MNHYKKYFSCFFLALFSFFVAQAATKTASQWTQRTGRIYTHSDMHLNLIPDQSAQIEVFAHGTLQKIVTINSQSTELGFDIDGVVLSIMGFVDYVKPIISNAKTAAIFTKDILRDWYFDDKKGKAYVLLSTLSQPVVNANILQDALNKYEPGLGNIVNQTIDRKNLKRGMSQVIHLLDAYGYTMRPMTNQSEREYIRTGLRLSDPFQLFQPGSWSHHDEQGNFIAKPSLEYFKKHIEQYNIYSPIFNPSGDKVLIFIDDKIENVKAAAEAGIIAIHCQSTKKLVADFRSLGLPAPSRLNNF